MAELALPELEGRADPVHSGASSSVSILDVIVGFIYS